MKPPYDEGGRERELPPLRWFDWLWLVPLGLVLSALSLLVIVGPLYLWEWLF